MKAIIKKTLIKYLAVVLVVSGLPATASATIIYDTWTSNDAETGNYIVTVDLVGGVFEVNVTVDPWNAEVLGIFFDWGDFDVLLPELTNESPSMQVDLIATDDDGNCGGGCNLNGLNIPLADPDEDWEWIIRLADTGFQEIQTFSFDLAANGATEDTWGLAGVRAQVLCSGDDVLPDDESSCTGSDKSYGGSSTPTPVPEPGTLALMGAGLLGIAFMRRRSRVIR